MSRMFMKSKPSPAMKDDLRNLPLELARIADLQFLQSRYEVDFETERAKIESWVAKALEMHPNHGVALAARGWSHFVRGDFDEAATWFQRALESAEATREREAVWLVFLGNCRLRRADWQAGDWKSALGYLVRARSLFPERPEGHFHLGTAFHGIGDMVSSQLSLTLAGSIDKNRELWGFFGKFVKQPFFADPDRVEASLRVLADPLDPAARISRGELLMSLELPRLALYDFMMADTLMPRNLGLLIRIEEIQVKGLLSGPPVYETPRPDAPLAPVFAEFLANFRDAYQSLYVPPALQPPLGPVENIFGPSVFVPSGSPWQFHAIPMIAGLVGLLIFAIPSMPLAIMAESIDFAQFLPLASREWVRFAVLTAASTFGVALLVIAFGWHVFGCYWFFFGLLRISENLKGWVAAVSAIPAILALPTLLTIHAGLGFMLIVPPILAIEALAGMLERIPARFALAGIFLGFMAMAVLLAGQCGLKLREPIKARQEPEA